MNNEIEITINDNTIVDSFEEFSLYMSMESIAGGMSFTTTDMYPDVVSKWGIKLGDSYAFKINGELVSSGYIDDIEVDEDELSNTITFGGRDKTQDLVDCHFIDTGSSGSWEKLTILQAIGRLCDPFNIFVDFDRSVANEINKPATTTFASDQATPVIDLIMKICEKVGILPMSTGNGFLTLTRATTTNFFSDLVDSESIKGRNAKHSDRDRFSKYIAKGQSAGNDTLTRLFDFITPASSEITDSHFKRERPLILLLDSNADKDLCLKRATFEKNARIGNSRQINYTLDGLTGAKSGKVWRPNYLVYVDDPILQKKDAMIISEVEMSGSASGGYETVLKLVDKKTYSLNSSFTTETGFD